MYVYVCVQVHLCADLCGGEQTTLGVILRHVIYFFETYSVIDLQFTS